MSSILCRSRSAIIVNISQKVYMISSFFFHSATTSLCHCCCPTFTSVNGETSSWMTFSLLATVLCCCWEYPHLYYMSTATISRAAVDQSHTHGTPGSAWCCSTAVVAMWYSVFTILCKRCSTIYIVNKEGSGAKSDPGSKIRAVGRCDGGGKGTPFLHFTPKGSSWDTHTMLQ